MRRFVTTLVAVLAILCMAWGVNVTPKPVMSGLTSPLLLKATKPQIDVEASGNILQAESNPTEVLARIPAKTSDGEEWEMTFERNSKLWCDILVFGSDKHKLTFEGYPWYLVTCTLQKTGVDSNLQHRIILPLFWPTVWMYNLEDRFEPADFEHIVSLEGTGYNIFSTQGLQYNDESNNMSIWNNTSSVMYH